jgi:hypothetical protein
MALWWPFWQGCPLTMVERGTTLEPGAKLQFVKSQSSPNSIAQPPIRSHNPPFDRKACRQAEADRQAEAGRQTDRETGRQTDRETERQRDREREQGKPRQGTSYCWSSGPGPL